MLSTVKADWEAVSWIASMDRLSIEHLDSIPRSGDAEVEMEGWGRNEGDVEGREGAVVSCP